MSDVVEQLVEMGFDRQRAEKAVGEVKTLEASVDWLAAYPEDTGSSSTAAPAAAGAVANGEVVDATAASFKCNDCGKTFRDENGMMFHASKTKHTDFSESTDVIKPLTEEEKKQKVAELQARIKQHIAAKEKIEEAENKEKERKRREEGKAMLELKEAQQEKQIREIAEERRRQKVEDEAAKKKVLEQIRLDREARKNRAAGVQEVQKAPAPAPVQTAPAEKKNYDKTNIQIRLITGQAVRQEFSPNEPLSMVRAWVETNHSNGVPFVLMTPFPRKVFTNEDMSKRLIELDLVPSANIVMQRQQ